MVVRLIDGSVFDVEVKLIASAEVRSKSPEIVTLPVTSSVPSIVVSPPISTVESNVVAPVTPSVPVIVESPATRMPNVAVLLGAILRLPAVISTSPAVAVIFPGLTVKAVKVSLPPDALVHVLTP